MRRRSDEDDLGLFEKDADDRHPGRDDYYQDDYAEEPRRPRRRRPLKWAVLGAGALVVLVGAWFGVQQVLDIGSFADYSGPGDADVLIQVQDGDSTNSIAQTLESAGVVASTRAFVKAGEDDAGLRDIQPGYYELKTKMSGKDAVARLDDPHSRVGNLQIRAGSQLDDVTAPNGSKTLGILGKLAQASCATLNGKSTCVSTDALRDAMAATDPAQLGVPDWALPNVKKADPKRRLEGIIQPGVYDVKPGASAVDLLRTVVTASASKLQAAGMPDLSDASGFTPYQVLIMASLVEREAVPADFGKVARVTYNRLAANQALEYDSTINYVLDRPEIRTRPADRAKNGAYNTYAHAGLPPTPISSPSPEAIAAAAKPPAGSWLFFVKCQKDGTSCFATTADQHAKNIADAQARGVY